MLVCQHGEIYAITGHTCLMWLYSEPSDCFRNLSRGILTA